MLLVGASRDFGLEVAFGERPGQLLATSLLEVIELFAIGQEVEAEDFNGSRLVSDLDDASGVRAAL
jgi:hypothetical protein